jgi:protein-tyrosine kinase
MSKIYNALARAMQDDSDGALFNNQIPRITAFDNLSDLENGRAMPVSQAPSACPAWTKPAWTPDMRTMLFLGQNQENPAAEGMRGLRCRLLEIADTRPIHTILVTSSLPQEGKTFIAANLAQTLAQHHQGRALLLDLDLRFPRLHQALGAPQSPGVAEYLRGNADEDAIIQCSPLERLFFIPSGRSGANSAEFISHPRLRSLLESVGQKFDWVIVDSPPAGVVSDASFVARICDGILLVVRAGTTPLDAARKTCQVLANGPIIGVVLNRVSPPPKYSDYLYGSK